MRTFLLFSMWLVSAVAFAQEKGGDGITGPYDVVAGWPQDVCGDGWQQGNLQLGVQTHRLLWDDGGH